MKQYVNSKLNMHTLSLKFVILISFIFKVFVFDKRYFNRRAVCVTHKASVLFRTYTHVHDASRNPSESNCVVKSHTCFLDE